MNEIDQFLRANRAAFTREALTKRLIEEGHAPEDVAASWARVEAGDRNWSTGVSTGGGRPGIGTVLLIIAVVIGYGFVGAYGLFGIGFVAYYGNYDQAGSLDPLATGLMVVYVGAMLAGLGFSIRRLWRAPSLAGSASAIGAAFAIAFAVLIGINGACIAGVMASSALGGLR